jgi:single-strand DNA-binding protein
MNIVALIGNLATDPELRHTSTGRAVCTFRIAVSRVGPDQADFFTVVAWERQAEVCQEYLRIGRRVAVEGRVHQSSWEHEGERRSRVEIIAHRVQMLGRPPHATEEPHDPFAPAQEADSSAELTPA